jgi:tetratricopeptide (TPR) repeat protein
VHQLEGHARQRPVLALFEDMHWIDSTTLELLDIVVGRVPHLPVMLCITCRPEFHPPWTGLAHVSTLTLGRLGQREASMLVAGVAGHKALPDEIMQRIIGRADGIPLFVEELTKTLLEGGMLREEDDRYVLDGSLPAFAIPSSLHASLMARLDRLSPVKEIAQIGAAIGREFSYELVAGLARRNDRELREALDQLVASGLIFRRGSPPAESYVFKHALVQDAAYGSLLRRPRQDLHARIGKVLEQRFPETAATQPEILAHHYTEAGLADPAIDYWRRAGERSLRRSANVEGVTHLTHAIELIGSLPATAERNRRELDLHLSLGQMMRATQGYAAPDTLRVFSRARDLLGEGATVDEQKTVLYGLWSVHYVRAEHTSARAVADQCLALAPQAQDADVAALANMLIGCSLLAMGALTDSRHHLGRTRDLSLANKADPIVSRFSQNNGIAALSYLAWALWPLGYLDQAVTAARDAVARARRTGHVPLTAFALYVEGFLGAAFGAEDDAVARVSEAVAYCVEHRVTAYEHWARFCEGVALARHGEAQNGIEVMRDAMNAAEKLTADFLRPLHLGHLAAVHTNIGQPDLALGLLDQAIHSAVKTGERFFEAELYRLKGEALCALGSRSEGETELERALTVAQRQQARLWELRAAASLSGVLRDRGNAAKARDLLGPVYDWFTEGFDTPDLVRARAALGVLG